MGWSYSDGNHPYGGIKCKKGMKKITVATKCEYKTVNRFSNGIIFNDLA